MSAAIPFCWYELMTPDSQGAAAFYGKVIGWSLSPPDPASPMDYRMILRSDGGPTGGLLPLNQDMQTGGARPAWLPYLATADFEATLAAMEADGARALMPATEIAEGTFALMADPQGAVFYLMKPKPPVNSPDAQSSAFKADGIQHVRWNELSTSDPTAAKAFYARHFGFEFNGFMPMGDAGNYDFIDVGGQVLGAIMPIMDPSSPPAWLTYFGVPSVALAKTAIEHAGGTVIMGPHEVPGEDWIVVATDPQGAVFGVVGPKGE